MELTQANYDEWLTGQLARYGLKHEYRRTETPGLTERGLLTNTVNTEHRIVRKKPHRDFGIAYFGKEVVAIVTSEPEGLRGEAHANSSRSFNGLNIELRDEGVRGHLGKILALYELQFGEEALKGEEVHGGLARLLA